MVKITAFDRQDARFPTSRSLAGSDAMNPDPDYTAASEPACDRCPPQLARTYRTESSSNSCFRPKQSTSCRSTPAASRACLRIWRTYCSQPSSSSRFLSRRRRCRTVRDRPALVLFRLRRSVANSVGAAYRVDHQTGSAQWLLRWSSTVATEPRVLRELPRRCTPSRSRSTHSRTAQSGLVRAIPEPTCA